MSILSGGGVRVGLEDNIWYDPERTKLATNRELVERIVSIAHTLGYEKYTAAGARMFLGLR
jgi:3-keto-5-aminohexanoate cleavage enzyme